jgi:bacteriorhodopsin
MNAWLGFILGMAGWGFILFEVFFGEAGQAAVKADKTNPYVKSSYNTMRLIVTIGWSIYPLGYFFGYLMGAVDDNVLNLTYNLADMLNKIWFVAAIWHAAKQETAAKAKTALLA